MQTDTYTGRPLNGWIPCHVCGTLALDPHINQRPCVECGTDPVADEGGE